MDWHDTDERGRPIHSGASSVRVNEPVAGPFTLAHLISGAVTIAGIVMRAKKARPAS